MTLGAIHDGGRNDRSLELLVSVMVLRDNFLALTR